MTGPIPLILTCLLHRYFFCSLPTEMISTEQSLLDAGYLTFGAQEGRFIAWRICALYCQAIVILHGLSYVSPPSSPVVLAPVEMRTGGPLKGMGVALLVYCLAIHSGNRVMSDSVFSFHITRNIPRLFVTSALAHIGWLGHQSRKSFLPFPTLFSGKPHHVL